MYAIEAKGLVKQFDGFHAVDGVDLKIPEGSIFGILGPNGAGKTTMLRTLLGIIDPDAGTRSLLGSDRPITQSRNVGYLPEERGLYQSMRAVDTIAFMGALRGLSLKEGAKKGRALLEEAGLGYAADRQIRQLSKGMAQTVQLMGTIVHDPKLIVLDEPFSGLDELADLGFHRVLTSGGPPTALEGIATLRQLVEKASGRLEIVAAGGVRAGNAKALLDAGLKQLHASCKAPFQSVGCLVGQEDPERVDRHQVAELVRAVSA